MTIIRNAMTTSNCMWPRPSGGGGAWRGASLHRLRRGREDHFPPEARETELHAQLGRLRGKRGQHGARKVCGKWIFNLKLSIYLYIYIHHLNVVFWRNRSFILRKKRGTEWVLGQYQCVRLASGFLCARVCVCVVPLITMQQSLSPHPAYTKTSYVLKYWQFYFYLQYLVAYGKKAENQKKKRQ